MQNEGLDITPEDMRSLLEPPRKPLRKLPEDQINRIKADIAELSSSEDKLRWRAASRLGRRRGLVVEFLAEAAADANPDVRLAAFYALMKTGDMRAFPVILELAQRDPVADNRWWALDHLGELGKERAIPVLIDALVRTPDSCDTDDMANADGARDGLKKVGAPAIPALVELLETGSKLVRQRAADVLSQIGGETEFGLLVKLLDDPDPEMRVIGLDSLAFMAMELEATTTKALEKLRSMFSDPDESVRDSAVSSVNDVENWVDHIQKQRSKRQKSTDQGGVRPKTERALS